MNTGLVGVKPKSRGDKITTSLRGELESNDNLQHPYSRCQSQVTSLTPQNI